MAIDFIICCLLLLSFTINLLALCAFCRTPGLRSTAGRFVINLLIINLVGCCILASTLYCIGNSRMSTEEQTLNNDYSLDIIPKDIPSISLNKSEQSKDIIFMHNNSTFLEKLTIKEMDKHILVMKDDEKLYKHAVLNSFVETSDEIIQVNSNRFMRLWSIDLAAALGGLSVLVVVGDTWMAVRDPLRYHRRVSKDKAWLLIALNWTLGIIFGVMSACWQTDFEWFITIGKEKNCSFEQIQVLKLTINMFFSNTFAYIYLVVIILLPFGFVCGMYWKIFSEAKENGLRMRKYTSSFPLHIQLTTSSRNQQHQRRLSLENTNVSSNKLQMNKDRIRKSLEEIVTKQEETEVGNINQNKIMLNCSSVNAAAGEINKNNSLNPFLKRSSEENILSDRLQAIQQIYSTPNLQKYYHGNFLIGFEISSHLHYMAHPRLHDYSFFKYRKESRAARISILVVIMFLVSYLPYGFLALLQGSQTIKNFNYSTQLAIFMILLANLISPFIFAYRNKRVRHGVFRLFGFDVRSRNIRLHHKSFFVRFITKISISVKRNSRKLSTYSMSSYFTSIPNYSREKLHNTKYDMNTFGKHLTNSASIQSSTMFGNISFLNAIVDIQDE